jgi:replicative DNA helicase
LADNEQDSEDLTPEEKLVREHQRLLAYDGPDRVVVASEVWKRATAKGTLPVLAKSGVDLFDEKLKGGFFPGQLIVISGFTGEGKTSWCRTLTDSFSKQGINPLWFSFEEVEEEFLEKFPTVTRDFFYMPNQLVDKNVKWIHERIKEGRLKYGCKAVFVDHLHYLIDMYQVKNAAMEIGAIMRSLKKIAIKNRIAFFLICHVAKIDKSRELQAGDTRDSGMIEAESDVVMYVWRDKNKEDTSVIKITKNRKRGKVNVKATLHFNEALGIYDYGTKEE